ncbi:MAG: thioredoxin-disulfide reductase [Dehalococcoidia bacterium]
MTTHSTDASADVVILGAGPAGWTAALYAARAALRTRLFSGYQPGGQLTLTTEVENYPGFAHGVLGPELMEQMRAQALRFGAELVDDQVTRVDFSRRPLSVFCGERAYAGNAVIIATGAAALWLGIDSEERLRGHGVSSCATCDGFFFRNQEVAIVGGGDAALEEALHLTRFATRVTVVHRRDTLRASKIMQQRARANPRIAWALEQQVVEVLGDQVVDGVRLRNTRTAAESVLPVQGLFVAIGYRPNTELFAGQLALDTGGYIVTRRHTATSISGVFAAGDVCDRRYRQAITAAGEGCKAALDAEEYLTGESWTNAASRSA